MIGEYLLLEIAGFGIIFALIKWFRLDLFMERKRLVKTILITFSVYLIWDMIALTRGYWWFGNEFMLMYFGIFPIEELIFIALITNLGVLSLWMAGEKVLKNG